MRTLIGNKLAQFWLLVVPYFLLFYSGLYFSILIWYPEGLGNSTFFIHFKIFTWVYVLWAVVFYIYNLFDLRVLRRVGDIFRLLVPVMVINFVVASVFLYFQPAFTITPRRFLLLDVLVSGILVLVWLIVVRYLIQTWLVEELYVLGSPARRILGFEAKETAPFGYRLVAYIEPEKLKSITLERFSLIIPQEIKAREEILREIYRLRNLEVNFYDEHSFYEDLFRKIHPEALSHAWFIENVTFRHSLVYIVFKKLTDCIVGLITGVLFLVTLPIFATLIKLSSAGKVFFTQERVGEKGKVFKIIKYRTMQGGNGDTWTEDNDPRITGLGKWLRRTRIDELPQCINLLRNEMSLVGPRPEQVHIVETLRKQIAFYDERHFVKPGLTGWAQLHVYAASVPESIQKLQYDLYYIKHRSILFDVEIILKTIYHILARTGK